MLQKVLQLALSINLRRPATSSMEVLATRLEWDSKVYPRNTVEVKSAIAEVRMVGYKAAKINQPRNLTRSLSRWDRVQDLEDIRTQMSSLSSLSTTEVEEVINQEADSTAEIIRVDTSNSLDQTTITTATTNQTTTTVITTRDNTAARIGTKVVAAAAAAAAEEAAVAATEEVVVATTTTDSRVTIDSKTADTLIYVSAN